MTREGYEYWDKMCAITRHAFLFSPCRKRIVATPDMGTWIDRHAALKVVDQAQDEINALRAVEAEVTALVEALELFMNNPTPTGEDFDKARAAIAAHRKGGELCTTKD